MWFICLLLAVTAGMGAIGCGATVPEGLDGRDPGMTLDAKRFDAAYGRFVAGPKLLFMDPDRIAQVRARLDADDPFFRAALKQLVAGAEKALQQEPISVTEKEQIPPSGDKRDYMSLSIYWWPNPVTTYPYIERDGVVNPEYREYDLPRLSRFVRTVSTLGLAYGFTGDERYAGHAAKLLRVWFLDDATRMNPHMKHAQIVPGLNFGNRWGVLETQGIAQRVLDAITLIRPSAHWSDADHAGVEAWIRALLRWLREHPFGIAEREQPNNHGTWYDVQVAAYALWLEERDLAFAVLARRAPNRLVAQIEADGRMPAELARTRSLSYSLYNLDAWFALATMAERVGLDLWRYRGPEGEGLRQALAYLVRYLPPDAAWPHEQITRTGPGAYRSILRRAAWAYDEPAYERLLQVHVRNASKPRRADLIWPPYPLADEGSD